MAAYLSLLERYGTKTVGEVLEPSIHYAERGIPNYDYMLERIDSPGTISQFQQYAPGGLDVFYDEDGGVPKAGSLLTQKALGGILRKLADAESAAGGHRRDGVRAARDCFYTGEVAQIIADCSERVGGVLDMDSLAAYEAKYETPIKTSYLGYEIHGQSAWTQGAVLMQALNILENFDLRAMGHNSTAYIHTVSQAVNLAFADREAYYGDPDFVDVPIDGLLSKEYARERSELIDPEGAARELPPPGDPWRLFPNVRDERRASAARATCGVRRSRRRGRGQRHDAYIVHRPRRQYAVRHAVRRRVRQVRILPRTRMRAQHPNRNAQLRGWTPEPIGAAQASAHYANQLHRYPRRRSRHDRRLSGRRPSGAGELAASPKLAALGHEPAGSRRSAALRQPRRPQQLLPAHLLPRPARRRAGHIRRHPERPVRDGTRRGGRSQRRHGRHRLHARSGDRRAGVIGGSATGVLRDSVVE